MDKKQKKKLKRAAKKKKTQTAEQQSEAKLKKQMNMFSRMPNACSVCQRPFPRTREAHMDWRVTVRTAEQEVRLFCLTCQGRATKLMENNNEV